MTYESQGFFDELKKRVNSDLEYRDKAKGMNLKVFMIVKDVPFATYSTYSNGELVERKHLKSSEIDEARKNADFVIEIPTYDLSVEMAADKKSLESLFLTGQIKFEGSIFKALQCRDALEKIAKITAQLTNESVVLSKDDFVKMLHEHEYSKQL